MTPAFSEHPLYQCWPFWVLELTPAASLAEVEKAARELAGKLRLGMKGADQFAWPGGTAARDEYLLREARARLIDPNTRLACEYWYQPPLPADEPAAATPAAAPRRTAAAWLALLEGRPWAEE